MASDPQRDAMMGRFVEVNLSAEQLRMAGMLHLTAQDYARQLVKRWRCPTCSARGELWAHPMGNVRSPDAMLAEAEVDHALAGCNGSLEFA